MRTTAFYAGALLAVSIFTLNTGKAHANQMSIPSTLDNNINLAADISVPKKLQTAESDSEKLEEAQPKKPEVTKHTVAEDETLSKIANDYEGIEWTDIFYKNTDIDHPDEINPGMEIVIPREDEELEKRELPAPEPEPTPSPAPAATATRSTSTSSRSSSTSSSSSTRTYARGSSAGNTYYYGYCTWYVKNRRPDLPNNLGNAETWGSRAIAQGIPTGSTPRVGAVGQRNNHVVYVERVNSDGTILISEMNREGWNVKSSRTVSASYFPIYIY